MKCVAAALSRRRSDEGQTSDAIQFRVPIQSEFGRRRHEPEKGRRRDYSRAGQIALAAKSHTILPVPVERRDCALSWAERVWPLAEARPAPRLPDLASDRPEYLCNRLAGQPGIRRFDLAPLATPGPPGAGRRSSHSCTNQSSPCRTRSLPGRPPPPERHYPD
jgi:hypothetical protein